MNLKKPTPDMIRAVELLLTAMAYEFTVRPIVESYQREILARHHWESDPRWHNTRIGSGPVLDPRESHNLTEEDFAAYWAECKIEQGKTGLKTKTIDNCPLLEAESAVYEAKRAVEVSLRPLTGFTDKTYIPHDKFAELIDLTLKGVAPSVRPVSQILSEFRKAA